VKSPISFASLVGRRPSPSKDAAPLDLGKLTRAGLLAERDRVLSRAEAHQPPITRVIPVPRAVQLGGREYVASELTLGDLAELQAWLEEAEPHPLEGLPPAWADPEPETRPARLAAAWERARAWPPRLGTDRGAELLASPGGRAFFLTLCLRRARPDFGPAEALDLLRRITPTEWSALRRVAYAITPREELVAELDDGADAGDGPPDWCRSVHNAIQAEGCPDYAGLAALHLGQWRNLCSQGKAAEKRPDFGAAVKRVVEKLKGLINR
jgi:hypothetical protein